MTRNTDMAKIDIETLKALDRDDKAAHAIFDALAVTMRNNHRTNLFNLKANAETFLQKKIDIDTVRAIFRKFMTSGAGQLINDKKGHSNRFHWNVGILDVVRAVRTQPEVKAAEAPAAQPYIRSIAPKTRQETAAEFAKFHQRVKDLSLVLYKIMAEFETINSAIEETLGGGTLRGAATSI